MHMNTPKHIIIIAHHICNLIAPCLFYVSVEVSHLHFAHRLIQLIHRREKALIHAKQYHNTANQA